MCLPAFDGKLKELYGKFHRRFDAYADRWTAKAIGLYTPHVSLAYRSGSLDPAALIRLTEAFSPFEAQVQGISLSWIRGENDYEILASYPVQSSQK